MKRNKARRRRMRRGRRSSNGTTPFTRVSSAPAGTNEFLQHYTRFRGSGETLGIEACLPICEVNFDPVASGNPGSLAFQAGSSTVTSTTTGLGLTQVMCLTPNTGTTSGTVPYLYSPGDYLSPVFDLLGSCFVRYKVNKLIFYYTPQATTTVNGRGVIAFADDPVHPVLNQAMMDDNITIDVLSATPPSQLNLLALGDSMAFAPWLPWSLDVSRRVKQNELYTAFSVEITAADSGFAPDKVTDGVGAYSATARQACFGAISANCVTTETNSFVGGILWMKVDLTLIEFCPISLTTAVPPDPQLLAKKHSRSLKKGLVKPIAPLGTESVDGNSEETEATSLEVLTASGVATPFMGAPARSANGGLRSSLDKPHESAYVSLCDIIRRLKSEDPETTQGLLLEQLASDT